MKDIIIVGTGKASLLHFKSYNKINGIGNIFFVDIDKTKKNKNIKTEKIYTTIKDVIEDNQLKEQDIIVDICTPKEIFDEIINQCIKLRIKNIIVEKPFVVNSNFFEKKEDLKIVMIQNYMYSKIVKDIKEYIEKNEYDIDSIYTNFSKNRIQDSIKRRGMAQMETINIEIEIPHQIYIVNYLIGKINDIKTLLFEQRDMIYNGTKIKKHGYGKIISIINNILVIHESDLMTENLTKEINIVCSNDIVINGEFCLYDKDLNIAKEGRFQVFEKGKLIKEKKYSNDDNMSECIIDAYNYFNNNVSIENKYKERILDFSSQFKKYIELSKESDN